MYYEKEYLVDSRDIDPWYHCRPSGLLGALQEAAVEAACALHVSRDETMAKYHCFWMLVRMWYRLNRPLSWGDRVTIRTWHRGARGDFDLYVEGKLVGEAVSTWVLADADTHRIFRMSRVDEFQGTDGGELCKSRTLSGLHLPAHMEHVESRALHQVGYLAECRAGETIELCTGQEDGIWYVHGADPAGKSRFDGAVELSHITP